MAGYGRIFFTVGSASNYRSLLSSRSNLPNLQQCATMKIKMQKTLEKLGIPPKPKRPMSSYLKFLQLERTKPDNMDDKLAGSEKIKKMAMKWANYDPMEKEALRKAYDLEMLAYSKQLMTYEQSITPEQQAMLKKVMETEKVKADKVQLRKKCAELGRPKRPPTGFLQFLQESKYMKSKEAKAVDFVKDLAEKWRQMTVQEKSKYVEESQRLMEQYKHDMRDWEENMVRKGHIDVVRNRGLMAIKTSNQGNTE